MRNVFVRLALARRVPTRTPATAAELVEQARGLAARGMHDQAERAFTVALEQDDACYEAALELGLLYHRDGRHRQSADLLELACALHRDELEPHACLALAYQAMERWTEVLRVVERVIELKPDWSQAYNLLGVARLRLDNMRGAGAAFARALDLDPTNVEALNNLANVRKEAGDVESAISLYRRGLSQTPNAIALQLNLGLALHQVGRLDEAIACFEQVAARDPGNADAYTNLGVARQAQGDAARAENFFRRAVECDPLSIQSRANLATFLAEHGALSDAAAQLDAVHASDRTDLKIIGALAQVECACGRLQAAEARCRNALLRAPGNVTLNVTLGTVLRAAGDLESADACFARALSTDPSSAAARYNRATLALLRGDYRTGFELYESRFEAFGCYIGAERAMLRALGENNRWRGEPLEGRRVLLWAEQGYGDAIMMSRYIPRVRAAGARRVIVHVLPALARLFSAVPGVDEVMVDDGHALVDASFDLHAPLMSLPSLLGTERSSVPPPIAPRLDESMLEQWKSRLEGDSRRCIGIVWQGSPALRDNHLRNVPFELLRPRLADGRFRFVSLQKAPEPDLHDTNLSNWMEECDDFVDTAGLIRQLDLVIAVDTAVAHLSGALGVPTWLLNRHGSEWRWGLEGASTAWYPSMRIFRQEKAGDWTDTIAELQRALDEQVPSRSDGAVAVELGISITDA